MNAEFEKRERYAVQITAGIMADPQTRQVDSVEGITVAAFKIADEIIKRNQQDYAEAMIARARKP